MNLTEASVKQSGNIHTKGPEGVLLKILGKVNVTEVCVIRPTKEFDGGGIGKNVGEGERLSHGCRALSSKRWDRTEQILREKKVHQQWLKYVVENQEHCTFQ
jgi:hypothetical protein